MTSSLTVSSVIELRNDPDAWPSIATSPAAGSFQQLLVATDGTVAADGALHLADLLSRRDETRVGVLSVLDPGSRPTENALVEEVEDRFGTVRARVGTVIGPRPNWHASIDIGPVGETICRVADSRSTDLIIVGFGQHRRLRDRVPEKATVRQIAELASVPLLIVPSSTRRLPASVMLALDFSRSSLRAGRAALQVMDAPGTMHLVYVHTNYEPFPEEPADPDPTYAAGFATFFDAVERELGVRDGITFERAVVRRGDPVSELMAYASTNSVELIAVGNHGQATRDRLHLGSVSSGLLCSAQCPVLVAGIGDMEAGDVLVGRQVADISGGGQ